MAEESVFQLALVKETAHTVVYGNDEFGNVYVPKHVLRQLTSGGITPPPSRLEITLRVPANG